MTNSVSVCPATSEDAFAIVTVRRQTWIATYPNEEFNISRKDIEDKLNSKTIEEESQRIARTVSENPSIKYFVAKVSDTVVGYVVVIKGEAENKIGAIYILPGYQGKGIGTLLMEKGLEWIGDEKDITFGVATYNTPAIDFYRKFGFIENGAGNSPVCQLTCGKTIPEIGMIRKGKK